MKKVALSLFVLAASAAYVWGQSGAQPADDLLGAAPPGGDILTGSIPRRAPAGAATAAAPAILSSMIPPSPQHTPPIPQADAAFRIPQRAAVPPAPQVYGLSDVGPPTPLPSATAKTGTPAALLVTSVPPKPTEQQ